MALPSLLLPGCEKAPAHPDLNYVPPGGVPYTTRPGDDWWKLAERPDVKALTPPMSALGLCEFNFRTRIPAEINWYLHNKAGCNQPTPDKKNYRFVGGEKIYLPTQATGASPLPPTPLSPETVRGCIAAVRQDATARQRIESLLRLVPGGASGFVRNALLVLCDSFSDGKVKACDPGEPNSYANRMVCTGIAEAACAAIEHRKAAIRQLTAAGTVSRDVPFAHTAVLIAVQAPGCALTEYALDWWRSLNIDHPWVSPAADFRRGLNGYRF